MSETIPDDPYLRYPRRSYVPEGTIAQIAPAPGQLCSNCNAIDFASYFTENRDFERALSEVVSPENDVDGTIHNICLGTYDEVSRKALTCELCQLVIKALTNKTTELHRPKTSPNGIQIYLDNVLAGFYFDSTSRMWLHSNKQAPKAANR